MFSDSIAHSRTESPKIYETLRQQSLFIQSMRQVLVVTIPVYELITHAKQG